MSFSCPPPVSPCAPLFLTHPSRWEMVVFHNLDPNSPMLEERVAEVVMRSCAAPSYFPTYQNYVDGAMHSNDPG